MIAKYTYSIRFTISSITLLITAGLALLLLSEGVFFGKEISSQAMHKLFQQITEKTSDRVTFLNQRPKDLIEILVSLPQIQAPPLAGQKHPATQLFVQALNANKDLYGIYVGHENGDLFMLANLKDWPFLRKKLQAPENTHWSVISIVNQEPSEAGQDFSKRLRTWEFLSSELQVLATKVEVSDYDTRLRPWYKAAQKTPNTIKTKPYIYSSLQAPGISFAKTIMGSEKVLGVDISLKTLSHFMAEQKVTENSLALLINREGEVLASPDSSKIIKGDSLDSGTARLPKIGQIYPELETELTELTINGGGTRVINQNTGQLMSWVRPINSDSQTEELLVILAPLSEIFKPYHQFGQTALLTAIFSILLFMPLAWFISTRISKPIRELANETKKLEKFQFHEVLKIKSRIRETAQLSDSFNSMVHSIANYRSNLMHTSKKLELLVELGIALSAEKDENKLMEMILLAAKDLANADGGTLYIREEDKQADKLRFEIIRNDTLDIALGGTTGLQIDLPAVPLRDFASGEENHHNIASHAVLLEKTVNISDAYADTKFDFSGTRGFDEKTGYHSKSFLTVPLKTRGGEVIGALQLINARDKEGKVISFSAATQDLVEALAAQAAVALENRNLVQAQIKLFDSMIELIARAIDAKSPYTAGHCMRVPEICLLLTKEASHSNSEPFKDFRIDSQEQWRELSVSAWLHDCGKLTTPEYVVDKATKLETIYDRFHEIRTRFEVLRRDYEISYLNGLLSKQKTPEILQQELTDNVAQLEDDFLFLAECNQGGEFMAAEKIERLKQVGKRTWLRYFSDRVGLSRDESLRKNTLPEVQLPAVETLLADRPEHIIRRTCGQELYGENNPYDIKMDVPENLYNLGEIYNLSIEKGTLTAEERFKINEHIIQTIAMLQRLPFPKQMAKVAEYAGAHHETLIGTGYPRKLKLEDMSIPARIMAIADIFEALTASDRPYKHPKTLSESIRIMDFMRKDQHIDSDLFELFLSSGIYERYARDYLKPEQIDAVDLTQYLKETKT